MLYKDVTINSGWKAKLCSENIEAVRLYDFWAEDPVELYLWLNFHPLFKETAWSKHSLPDSLSNAHSVHVYYYNLGTWEVSAFLTR